METLPQHVSSYRDRHGKTRYRMRRPGRPSVSINAEPGTERFNELCLHAETKAPPPPRRPVYAKIVHEIGDRAIFWRYCTFAAEGARGRAKTLGLPFNLNARDLDQLLVDQGWRCAVSGIAFDIARVDDKRNCRPFGPGLDRIEPIKGYVNGNVRLVCNIVNFAMNGWGLDALLTLVDAMNERAKTDRLANL